MYVRWTPVEIQTSAHMDLINSSMTAPTPLVIAQQYSSASFVSLRFLSCKEELGAHSNNPTVFSFTLFFNCGSLKLRNSASVFMELSLFLVSDHPEQLV
jgi:hypothetical protein